MGFNVLQAILSLATGAGQGFLQTRNDAYDRQFQKRRYLDQLDQQDWERRRTVQQDQDRQNDQLAGLNQQMAQRDPANYQAYMKNAAAWTAGQQRLADPSAANENSVQGTYAGLHALGAHSVPALPRAAAGVFPAVAPGLSPEEQARQLDVLQNAQGTHLHPEAFAPLISDVLAHKPGVFDPKTSYQASISLPSAQNPNPAPPTLRTGTTSRFQQATGLAGPTTFQAGMDERVAMEKSREAAAAAADARRLKGRLDVVALQNAARATHDYATFIEQAKHGYEVGGGDPNLWSDYVVNQVNPAWAFAQQVGSGAPAGMSPSAATRELPPVPAYSPDTERGGAALGPPVRGSAPTRVLAPVSGGPGSPNYFPEGTTAQATIRNKNATGAAATVRAGNDTTRTQDNSRNVTSQITHRDVQDRVAQNRETVDSLYKKGMLATAQGKAAVQAEASAALNASRNFRDRLAAWKAQQQPRSKTNWQATQALHQFDNDDRQIRALQNDLNTGRAVDPDSTVRQINRIRQQQDAHWNTAASLMGDGAGGGVSTAGYGPTAAPAPPEAPASAAAPAAPGAGLSSRERYIQHLVTVYHYSRANAEKKADARHLQ